MANVENLLWFTLSSSAMLCCNGFLDEKCTPKSTNSASPATWHCSIRHAPDFQRIALKTSRRIFAQLAKTDCFSLFMPIEISDDPTSQHGHK